MHNQLLALFAGPHWSFHLLLGSAPLANIILTLKLITGLYNPTGHTFLPCSSLTPVFTEHLLYVRKFLGAGKMSLIKTAAFFKPAFE